jgi:ankyrin repeat protein
MTPLDPAENHRLQEALDRFLYPLSLQDVDTMAKVVAEEPLVVHTWKESSKNTPLRLATLWSYPIAARFLLEHGVDVNAPGEAGRTPLHEATRGHRLEMISLLLEYGADVESRDESRRTPLHWVNESSGREALTCLRLLLKHGADPNAADGDGQRPLHHVKGEVRPAIALLNAGADPCGRDRSGRTPLHEAAHWFTPLSALLLRRGADPNARDADGQSPLYDAVWNWGVHAEDVQRLLDAGADPNLRDFRLQTPLHMAAARHCIEGARVLVAAGAALDACDDEGRKPLYRAQRGPYVVDDCDYVPGSREFKIGRAEMVNYLKSLGAR